MSGEKEHKHSSILCCDCIHQDIASRAHTAGAAQERAAIVAWLRTKPPTRSPYGLADDIERGAHEKGEK